MSKYDQLLQWIQSQCRQYNDSPDVISRLLQEGKFTITVDEFCHKNLLDRDNEFSFSEQYVSMNEGRVDE